MDRAPGIPRPTLRRQLRAAGILAATIVGVLGIAYAVYYFTVGRPLLGGDHDHDFGTVQLVGNRITLDHTFVLTNRTGHPVEIQDIKTSCGCTVASPSERTLAPGASVEIDTTLTMRRDGRKTARVYLNFGDDGVEVLRLEATARNRQRLIAPAGGVKLQVGGTAERTIVYLDYDSNDEPPLPRITPPPGVEACFVHWTQSRRRRRSEALPARWYGKIQIEQVAATLPDDATLLIHVGPDQTLALPLDISTPEPGLKQPSNDRQPPTSPQPVPENPVEPPPGDR